MATFFCKKNDFFKIDANDNATIKDLFFEDSEQLMLMLNFEKTVEAIKQRMSEHLCLLFDVCVSDKSSFSFGEVGMLETIVASVNGIPLNYTNMFKYVISNASKDGFKFDFVETGTY